MYLTMKVFLLSDIICFGQHANHLVELTELIVYFIRTTSSVEATYNGTVTAL